MKECDILGGVSKHTPTPPTYFKGVRTSQSPHDLRPCYDFSDAYVQLNVCDRSDVYRRDEWSAGLHPESQLAGTVPSQRGVYVAHHARAWSSHPRRHPGDIHRRRGQVSRLSRHEEIR